MAPLTEPCALRSTQLLKVSTRDFSWGKGGRCVWLTTYHPCSAETSRKSGALNYPEPLGPPRPVAGHLYFTLHTYIHTHTYVYAYTHTHTYIRTYIHIQTYVRHRPYRHRQNGHTRNRNELYVTNFLTSLVYIKLKYKTCPNAVH